MVVHPVIHGKLAGQISPPKFPESLLLDGAVLGWKANIQHTPLAPAHLNGGVKDASGRTTEYFSMDDQCPVCKSDRYLNPKLRLLVSSCYHKMCESCIDRLFTLGPAPCPICQKVLRKLAFTPQTFEDLTVEKEIAVRRRIAKEFNKRREDFFDLHAYNDYLEEVEDITLKEQEELERQEKEQRTLELRREQEIEREERETAQREIIDRLETSTKSAVCIVVLPTNVNFNLSSSSFQWESRIKRD
ncbi:CDK-activating kinase assembly factor MAT1-domain-containing protein [Suillus clintonianus]|uniref:CDK-activating kinase assembly factor MAT1-domain-containing protein n=1 Tax=Suillus clintonianus TaxID=1904413 RepID=UPI001B85CDFD|nr:CDK-activating kinase assembly factor MAT1-domain-containing protein [Suillus clintonianus]KAG2149336.1 CDK-activating kinase assembly factor MAT1-domain-containing protein [Suillus clintonianus]